MTAALRLAVVGCGGIGTVAGTAVSRLPETQVSYCVRRPVAQIVVDTPDRQFWGNGEILTSPDQAHPVDLVILATKAQDTVGAMPWLTALCGSDTPVLVLQNGVEHQARVQPLVPGRPIVPAIVWFGAQRTGLGRVRLTLPGNVTVPDTKTGRRIAAWLDSPLLPFRVSTEFGLELWTKFVTNVTSNSLTAILDVPVSRLPLIPEASRLIDQLVEECRTVAAAAGIALPHDLAASTIDRFRSFDDSVLSSTQVDRLAGRPFEYDAIIGAVVRLGDLHRIRTDTARVVLSMLTAISQSAEIKTGDGSGSLP